MIGVDSADDGVRAELDGIDMTLMSIPDIDESRVEQAIRNLSLFNTQPHFLDKYLPKWIRHLGDSIKNGHTLPSCALFHSLSMVRGLKACMAFLPNDLELLEDFIVTKRHLVLNDDTEWRVKYTMYSWFAAMAKQPFHFDQILADYELFEEIVESAKKVAMTSRPEARPAILLLVHACFSDHVKSDALLESAVENGNYELVYRLFKQNAKTIVDVSKILSIGSNTSSREAAKWKCKLLPLLLDHQASNQQISALLFHKDVSIREQMAKSLSKVRLTDDFVKAVIQSMPNGTPHESDLPVMHGACMLIGYSLLRRTVSIKPFTADIQSRLTRCLWFDYCKGTFSVGPVVRDAACFVVWAWAKRQPTIMIPSGILEATLAMAVLDREVVLRRAAAAALQEAIGRGLLISGLSNESSLTLLNTVNYYSVTNFDRCVHIYCELHHNFPSLRPTLTRMLTDTVMPHWDDKMRRMAAMIHKQCQCVDSTVIGGVLEGPVMDLYMFHSSALCYYNTNIIKGNVKPKAVFNTKELGAPLLLESLLLVMAKNEEIDMVLLEPAMSFKSDTISNVLIDTIIPAITKKDTEPARQLLLLSLPRSDKTTDQWARCNWIRVMSCVPLWFKERLPSYARLLVKLLPVVDCRARVCCLQAMSSLISRFGGEMVRLLPNINEIISIGFDDYTVDPMEGDVGSLVRLQTIDMIYGLRGYCDLELVKGHLITLAVGRLDRVRQRALSVLGTLFDIHCQCPFEYIQQHRDLLETAVEGLVYTGGSRLQNDTTNKAITLLSKNRSLLDDFVPRCDRIASAHRLLLARLHDLDLQPPQEYSNDQI